MQEPSQYLAQALKSLRARQGWSLDETARRTGVSKAMLGQIERGESSPTLATLWKIAAGTGTPISAFLGPGAAGDGPGIVEAGALRSQPASDRMLIAPLFPFDPRFGFEMLELTLLPGYEREAEPHAAGVTEHVVVLSGAMELLVEGRWQPLAAGSALRFAADRPHGYRNRGPAPCVLHDLIHYPAAGGPAAGDSAHGERRPRTPSDG